MRARRMRGDALARIVDRGRCRAARSRRELEPALRRVEVVLAPPRPRRAGSSRSRPPPAPCARARVARAQAPALRGSSASAPPSRARRVDRRAGRVRRGGSAPAASSARSSRDRKALTAGSSGAGGARDRGDARARGAAPADRRPCAASAASPCVDQRRERLVERRLRPARRRAPACAVRGTAASHRAASPCRRPCGQRGLGCVAHRVDLRPAATSTGGGCQAGTTAPRSSPLMVMLGRAPLARRHRHAGGASLPPHADSNASIHRSGQHARQRDAVRAQSSSAMRLRAGTAT